MMAERARQPPSVGASHLRTIMKIAGTGGWTVEVYRSSWLIHRFYSYGLPEVTRAYLGAFLCGGVAAREKAEMRRRPIDDDENIIAKYGNRTEKRIRIKVWIWLMVLSLIDLSKHNWQSISHRSFASFAIVIFRSS